MAHLLLDPGHLRRLHRRRGAERSLPWLAKTRGLRGGGVARCTTVMQKPWNTCTCNVVLCVVARPRPSILRLHRCEPPCAARQGKQKVYIPSDDPLCDGCCCHGRRNSRTGVHPARSVEHPQGCRAACGAECQGLGNPRASPVIIKSPATWQINASRQPIIQHGWGDNLPWPCARSSKGAVFAPRCGVE